MHTLALVYWIGAGGIALTIAGLAPSIAEYWLKSAQLPPQTVAHAVMLMGLVIACRWPIGLYQGALMGAQRLTVSSGVSITMGTVGSLGAVATLIFVSPTIEAFFIWQACAGLLYAAAMRSAAWRVIGRSRKIKFDLHELKRIWRFSVGMSGVAVLATISVQMDKVVLSSVLSLEDFGRYALAWMIASSLLLLFMPVFNVIYPRFSALVAAGAREELSDLYRLGTRLLSAVLFPIAVVGAVTLEDIILLWTNNADIASNVSSIAALFLVGTAINGVMIFPYALQLAYGATRISLLICSLLVIVMLPLTIVLAQQFGAIGGASAWVLQNCIYLLMGSWLTHRKLLKHIGPRWLLLDVGVPLGLSLLIAGIVEVALKGLEWSHMENILISFSALCFSILLNLATSSRLAPLLRNVLQDTKAIMHKASA
jgi:O-antigen/teichoic acid export membrane protein